MAKSKNWEIENCFLYFPQFQDDYAVLENTGIIKRYGHNGCYEWTKNKTSLAQYFHWIAKDDRRRTQGGFWKPIETMFLIEGKPIKRGALSHNASRNGNEAKKEYSKDFAEIKNIVETYREEVKREEAVEKAVKECYQKIKDIVESSGNDSFQESDRALKKIVKTIEGYKGFVSKNK
jgi:hypothetical protein